MSASFALCVDEIAAEIACYLPRATLVQIASVNHALAGNFRPALFRCITARLQSYGIRADSHYDIQFIRSRPALSCLIVELRIDGNFFIGHCNAWLVKEVIRACKNVRSLHLSHLRWHSQLSFAAKQRRSLLKSLSFHYVDVRDGTPFQLLQFSTQWASLSIRDCDFTIFLVPLRITFTRPITIDNLTVTGSQAISARRSRFMCHLEPTWTSWLRVTNLTLSVDGRVVSQTARFLLSIWPTLHSLHIIQPPLPIQPISDTTLQPILQVLRRSSPLVDFRLSAPIYSAPRLQGDDEHSFHEYGSVMSWFQNLSPNVREVSLIFTGVVMGVFTTQSARTLAFPWTSFYRVLAQFSSLERITIKLTTESACEPVSGEWLHQLATLIESPGLTEFRAHIIDVETRRLVVLRRPSTAETTGTRSV